MTEGPEAFQDRAGETNSAREEEPIPGKTLQLLVQTPELSNLISCKFKPNLAGRKQGCCKC